MVIIMKILIAYATKHGTTAECASLLRAQLEHHEVDLIRIGKGGGDIPELCGYDVVIFGSNVRMARIDKTLAAFLRKNKDELSARRCAYFLCCGFVDCFEDYLYKNIPEELIDSADAVACFGGRLDTSRAKGLDKMIISMVRSNILGGGDNGQAREDISLPTVLETNIVQFADAIRGKR